jgi:hypothetical protein
MKRVEAPKPGLGLHLWTAWALVAAPLVNALAMNPEFLVAHDIGLPRLAALLLIGLVLVPLPWVALALLSTSGARWRPWLLLPPLVLLGLSGAISAGCGLAAGPIGLAFAALALTAYVRSPAVRRYFTWLAPIALVAPAMLLGRLDQLATSPAQLTADRQTANGAPTVVLILDELPITSLLDDRGVLDARRFPRLAALAETAHWFDNVLSVDSSTPKAVSALLTGAQLVKGQLPTARDLPRNLFTLLAPTHEIAALEPVTRLCPPALNQIRRGGQSEREWLRDTAIVALHLTIPEPLARRLPAIDAQWAGFGDPEVATEDPAASARPNWRQLFTAARKASQRDRVAGFDSFLATIDGRRSGALYFAHLLLPHRPWIYLPSGSTYWTKGNSEPPSFQDQAWPASPSYAAWVYQRHLLQSEFVDRLIGRLVDTLQEQGVWDDTLLAITADHGISFLPGEMKRGVTAANRRDVLQVPLLLKLPGQKRGVHHREARSTLDLLPTLLATLGIEVPTSIEGRSLLAPAGPAPARAPWLPGLARRAAVFGPLADSAALYALGPTPEWLGRRLTAQSLARDEGLSLELEAPGRRFSRRARTAAVPAWVQGRLSGRGADRRLGLALAVDGIVRATAAYEPADDRGRFRALLPEDALTVGAHELTIVVVDPESGVGVLPAVD